MSSNSTFVTFTNGVSLRFPPGEEETIPKYNPAEQELIRSFLSKRQVVDMTHADLDRWFSADYIYYRPDSGEGIQPVVFEYADEELYDEERAEDYWTAKGCK